MAKEDNLTAELLRQIISYDPETGEFRWKARTPEMFAPGNRSAESNCQGWNKQLAGKVAGSICPTSGYLHIRIKGYAYLAHRLAWLYVTGKWPKDEIDHINVSKADNVFSNLREATRYENSCNRFALSNNMSGVKGVGWYGPGGKWHARIRANHTTRSLGYFNNIDEAASAYARAAKELHGGFARTK